MKKKVVDKEKNKIVDAIKSGVDATKHQNTLSTGAILVLISFTEGAFSNPDHVWLIVVALSCLVMSILFGVILNNTYLSALYTISYIAELPPITSLRRSEALEKQLESDYSRIATRGKILVFINIGSFVLGMVSLTAFGIINFIG